MRAGGFAWGWDELSKNTLKGGGTEERGGETKILKKGGKLGQGGGPETSL